MRDLRAAGTTVVLTTHAMDEAEQLCDRVAIIDHGPDRHRGHARPTSPNAGGEDLRFSTTAGLDLPALAAALSLAPDAVREQRPGEYIDRAPR